MAIDDDPLASEWLGVLGLAGTQTLPKSCIGRAREPKPESMDYTLWVVSLHKWIVIKQSGMALRK